MTANQKVNGRGWTMEMVRWSEVERESEKAILVGIARNAAYATVWVPKSIMENWTTEKGVGAGTVELPVWWLIKNGF